MAVHDRGQLPAGHPDRAGPLAPRPLRRAPDRLLRQRQVEPPGRAVAAHPRQRRLRRPPDRGDPGPPLPRHEGDLLQRRQRLPGGRRRRSADRLRHGRRLRLRPLPRRGQGPRLRRRRRHQRRRVQRLLLARAAGDGRHGPRPRLPRRPRRSGGLRGGPPQGRPGRADRPPGDPSPGLTSDRLAVSRPDPAVGSPGAPVGAFVGLATLDLVLAVEHVPAPTRRSWRPTSSWRPAARRPTPRSPSPGPAGGRASSPCWAAIPWPRRPSSTCRPTAWPWSTPIRVAPRRRPWPPSSSPRCPAPCRRLAHRSLDGWRS